MRQSTGDLNKLRRQGKVLRFGVWLWRFLLEELSRDVLFLAHIRFSMYIYKFFPMGDFVILVEERVLRFAEFLFKDELAGHEKLASYQNIKEVGLSMIEFGVLVDVCV